jgi:type VI secretion system secreted protein VgrG
MRITAWEKSQQLGSGICTLWDHSFELPNKNLEAKRKTLDSVAQGVLGHNLQMVLGENLQATVRLNHQLTLGSNLQLFYNPL